MLMQKVPTLSQWKPLKEAAVRESDVKRKNNNKQKIERVYELLKKPMTKELVSQITGYSAASCYTYLHSLYEDGRVKRSGSPPYTYWR